MIFQRRKYLNLEAVNTGDRVMIYGYGSSEMLVTITGTQVKRAECGMEFVMLFYKGISYFNPYDSKKGVVDIQSITGAVSELNEYRVIKVSQDWKHGDAV